MRIPGAAVRGQPSTRDTSRSLDPENHGNLIYTSFLTHSLCSMKPMSSSVLLFYGPTTVMALELSPSLRSGFESSCTAFAYLYAIETKILGGRGEGGEEERSRGASSRSNSYSLYMNDML